MKRIAHLLFILSIALFFACDNNEGDPPIIVDDNPVGEDGMPKACEGHNNSIQYNANRAFAFDLLQSVNEADADKNIFLSPMSVSIALAMLYNGASGSAQVEMDEVLRLNGLDLESHNQNYYCLLDELTNLDQEVILNIANSVWSRNDFEAKEPFLNYATEFLNSEFFSVDFSDPVILDEINGWISDKTEGTITDALDEIPGNVIMYLINAIYFNADWKYSFDPDVSFEALFNNTNGTNSSIDFMSQTNSYRFTENDAFKAIDIPYANDAFSLSVFLPNDDINDFVKNFTDEAFVDAVSQFEEKDVHLTMPKFEMDYKILMNDVLAQMGMTSIFNFGFLENIGPGLKVSRVIHQTFLDIDEAGTEAAGVTIIEIVENAGIDPNPTMYINRPFLFFIRDRVNNNVLFSGKIVELGS